MSAFRGQDGTVKTASAGNQPGLLGEVKNFTLDITANLVEDTAMGEADRTFKAFQDGFQATIEAHFDGDDGTATTGQQILTEGSEVNVVLYPNFVGASPPQNQFEFTAIVESISIAIENESIVSVTFTVTGTGPVTRDPVLFFGANTSINLAATGTAEFSAITTGKIITPFKMNSFTNGEIILLLDDDVVSPLEISEVTDGKIKLTYASAVVATSVKSFDDNLRHLLEVEFTNGAGHTVSVDGQQIEMSYSTGSKSTDIEIAPSIVSAQMSQSTGYNYGLIIEDSGIEVANWPLNDGSGTTLAETINNNDATVTNPVWL